MAPSESRVDDLLEHAAFARRLARALVADDARADDVVQQAWVAALEHPPRPGRGLRSWLATVVRNAASKLRREEARRAEREERSAATERVPSTDEVAAQIAAQRELLDAVARLAEPCRSTVHQRFFEERTPTEIARRGGVPVRTVETRLRRGLEQLRGDLDRRFAGGREAWASMLVPLASRAGLAAAEAASVVVAGAGGIALSLPTKIGVAAVAVVIVAGGWTLVQRSRAPVDEARKAESQRLAAAAAVDRSIPAEGVAESPASRPPLAPERSSARCGVTVVTPDGRGLKGAVVVLFREDEPQLGTVLGDGVTDERGEVVLPISGSPCELAVLPGCAPAKRIVVGAKTSSIEVALDEGVVFSGWVTVDGVRPTEPIELRLGASRELYAHARFPGFVMRRLRELGPTLAWEPRATTDAEGNFAFFELASREPFGISFPVPYEDAATGREGIVVDEAREHVEIALRTNPAFRGRIVDLHGTPLSGWRVVPWAVSEEGSSSQPEATTDETGRFRSWLHNKHATKDHGGALIVYDPADVPMRRVEVTTSVTRGHDFGDVEVDASRRVALDVRDDRGRSVSDLVVIVERDASAWEVLGWNRFVVVKAQHVRAGFGVPVEAVAIRVLAAGFAAASVPCEPSSSLRRVDLEPAAQLTLEVRDDGDRILRRAKLEVSAGDGPMAWSRDDLQEAHGSLGGTGPERERDEASERLPFRFANYDKPFRLLALRPNVPITLLVRDVVGVEVLRETITLAPGEDRSLTRTVQTSARTIRGLVRSIDGVPLAGARVAFFRERRHDELEAETASDGTFVLEGVRADRGTLVGMHEGFSRRSLRDHVVDPATPVVIELAPGWSTDIGLFGGTTEPVPTAVWMEPKAARPEPDGSDQKIPGRAFDESPGPEGWSHGFEGLPDEPLLLRATIDGFTLAIPVKNVNGSSSYNAMLRGPVVIGWSVDEAALAERTLHAIRAVPRGGFHQARATALLSAADASRRSGDVRFEKLPLGRYGVAFVWRDASGSLTEELTQAFFDVRDAPMERVVVER